MKKSIFAILFMTVFICLMAQEAVLPLGSGTQSDPYQISTWQNLYWVTIRDESYNSKLSAHYVQTTDIELPEDINTWHNNLGWNYIGYGTLSESFPFVGYYNGQNHIIKNLFINRPSEDMVGLFGLTNHATISNLGLENLNVTASYGASGLIGEMDNETQVSNCFVKGSITGEAFVGGITGYNFASTISNCYFIGSLEGIEGIGGIAAYNDTAYVENCYVAATVSEGDLAGILVGCNDKGNVSNSFWDTDLAGSLDGIGDNSEGIVNNVLGKTTQEMKTQTTYTDANWDFNTLWKIDAEINESYPAFIWEHNNTSIDEINTPIAHSVKLNNAYPNPFNPSTTISFDLTRECKLNLSIYNAKGQKVKTLTDAYYKVGTHQIVWNGKDDNNKDISCGVYFYKLESDDSIQIKKAVLLK